MHHHRLGMAVEKEPLRLQLRVVTPFVVARKVCYVASSGPLQAVEIVLRHAFVALAAEQPDDVRMTPTVCLAYLPRAVSGAVLAYDNLHRHLTALPQYAVQAARYGLLLVVCADDDGYDIFHWYAYGVSWFMLYDINAKNIRFVYASNLFIIVDELTSLQVKQVDELTSETS